MIGRALNGRYELGEILGVGGMATVYRGLDRQLCRPVAVKVLNGGLADDPRFAERFSQEAQNAALLVHPRVVTVFDSGVDQGSPYIVMELVQGASLSQLLHRTGPLPVERAVGIAAAVCEALEAAHQQGLVHRDIKPGNVMITDDGGVKVVDFGIARANSSSSNLTQTATVLGTAAYLSPEQAMAHPVDGRTDLYALGCVVFEMLTGAPPFQADTPVGIAFQHVSEQPVPVSYSRPDVPPALDAAVLRLLAKNPDERPADAGQARAELLATVPLAGGADRTSELLLGGAGQATQVLPPVAGAAYGAPYQDAARTSVLPPMADRFPVAEPEREEGRRPLALLAVAAAAVLAVIGIGAFALSDSSGGKPQSGRTAAPTTAGASAEPSASASPSPTLPSASPVGAQNPAAAIAALRADVAQTPFNGKAGKQQEELIAKLDTAQALADQKQADAVRALQDAQKVVRELKKQAIDEPTKQKWLGQLRGIIASLHGPSQAPTQAQDEG